MSKSLREMNPKDIREKHVEGLLRDEVLARGGKCLKFSSPNMRSVPDRLVLFREYAKLAFFVECKAPGKKLTKLQADFCISLVELGHWVQVIDNYQGVDCFIEDFEYGGLTSAGFGVNQLLEFCDKKYVDHYRRTQEDTGEW